MIFRVYGLDEELKIVRLYRGSMLDGIRLGKSPITPVKVTESIVTHDDTKAVSNAPLAANILMPKSARTARSGITNNTGVPMKLE